MSLVDLDEADFRAALRFKVGDGFMTFASRLNSERRTDTDGWGLQIATTKLQFPNVEIWLDRYLGGTERRLWAGFSLQILTEAVQVF